MRGLRVVKFRMRMMRATLINLLLNARIYNTIKDFNEWRKRDFAENSPFFVKRKVLLNNCYGKYWIETGTYFGQMTRFLSINSSQVWTIEPDLYLLENAKKISKRFNNIEFIHGTSETTLEKLLADVSKITKDLNFWLDGHYSDGLTFKGEVDTPIKFELEVIRNFKKNFSNITIFIDDVRCFERNEGIYKDYPSLSHLVDWANQNEFDWKITHDIFIMTKI